MNRENEKVKIVVFSPKESAENIRSAISDAGGGVIGNYSDCTFSSDGIGRFKPMNGANPTLGEVGKMEEVIEVKIEFICLKSKAKEIITAIRKVHPYEEVPADIFSMISEDEL
jgi:hypothetical protein